MRFRLLVLALLTYASPAPADHGTPALATKEDTSKCSAISELIRANGRLPLTLGEWKKAMTTHGDGQVRQTIIPLSRAIHPGKLGQPRKALAVHRVEKPPAGKLPLTDRLFVAKAHAGEKSTVLEFISWNRETGAFDFGLVDDYDDPKKAKLRKVPNERCVSCHKSGGPIFTIAPWSDTTENLPLWRAMLERLAEQSPKEYKPVLDAYKRAEVEVARRQKEEEKKPDPAGVTLESILDEDPVIRKAELDGIFLYRRPDPIMSETADFDTSVASANTRLFFNEWVRDMEPKTRRRFLKDLFRSASEQAILGKSDASGLKKQVATLTNAEVVRRMASKPFRLHDYDPIQKKLNPSTDEPKRYSVREFLDFDERRSKGKEKIPAEAMPTNLAAFDPGSQFLTSEVETWKGDPLRAFLPLLGLKAEELAGVDTELTTAVAKGKKTKAEILAAALESKAFATLFDAPHPPDAETFKRILVAELGKALGDPSFEKRLLAKITHPASCPDTHTRPEKLPVVSKTDHCLRCHSGTDPVGGPLPFDPTNIAEWKRRLHGTDDKTRKEAAEWLPVILDRIEKKTMPPSEAALKEFAPERQKLIDFLKSEKK